MNKKIPLLNYIIMVFIIIVVISVCYYAIKIYHLQKKDQLNSSILGQYLNEIKINELNDYILENEYVILYICSSEIEKCRNFENNIENYIQKLNLRENMLYLNIKTVKNEYKNNYLSKIKTYINDFDEEKIPQIVVYSQSNKVETKKIETFDDIKQILDKYEVNYLND